MRPRHHGPAADPRAILRRHALAELIGTAFLLSAIVGSGIALERSLPGEPGLQLLGNAAATALALAPMILAFGRSPVLT